MVDKFEVKRFPKQPSCDMCGNQATWQLMVDDGLPLNLCEVHEQAVREYFKGKTMAQEPEKDEDIVFKTGNLENKKGICFAQIEKNHIHIALRWLRETGFKGKVEISEGFCDQPIFETKIE